MPRSKCSSGSACFPSQDIIRLRDAEKSVVMGHIQALPEVTHRNRPAATRALARLNDHSGVALFIQGLDTPYFDAGLTGETAEPSLRHGMISILRQEVVQKKVTNRSLRGGNRAHRRTSSRSIYSTQTPRSSYSIDGSGGSLLPRSISLEAPLGGTLAVIEAKCSSCPCIFSIRRSTLLVVPYCSVVCCSPAKQVGTFSALRRKRLK